MKPFEKFLAQLPYMAQYDQIEMSSTMADDPEVTKYCNITGGSGTRHGLFLGKSIRVVPDIIGVMFDDMGDVIEAKVPTKRKVGR